MLVFNTVTFVMFVVVYFWSSSTQPSWMFWVDALVVFTNVLVIGSGIAKILA